MFFHDLGLLDFKHKSLENQFRVIDDFIKNKNYYNLFHKTIIMDYLNYFNLKPKAWWDEKISHKDKNNILRLIFNNNLINIALEDLYKYSLLVNLNNDYILAIYKPNIKIIKIINKDTL